MTGEILDSRIIGYDPRHESVNRLIVSQIGNERTVDTDVSEEKERRLCAIGLHGRQRRAG
jgi:hypothetical protein